MRSDVVGVVAPAAPPLVIELVGLPGAGKSTVASLVETTLRARGRAFATRQELGAHRVNRLVHLVRIAAFTAARPEPTIAAVRAACATHPVTPVRLRDALRLSLWASRFEAVGRGDADLVLLDQGVVQQAWTVLVAASQRNERLLEAALDVLVASAPVAFAFVHVAVDVAVAAERIRSRPTMLSHFDHMSPAAASRMLAAHRDDLERLLACAVVAAGASRLTVDGHRTPAELAVEILNFIDGLDAKARYGRPSPGEALSGIHARKGVAHA